MPKKVLLGIVSAVFFPLGLHPIGWTFLSWFGWLPLFILYFDSSCRRRDLLLAAALSGVLYAAIGLYWLLYYKIWVYFLAVAVVAPFLTIYFTILSFSAKRLPQWLQVLSAPFFWVLVHKLYQISPIGASAIEVFSYGSLSLFQIASVTGLVGIGAMLIGLNAACAFFIQNRSLRSFVLCVFFALLLGSSFLWGRSILKEHESGTVKFALIQHNLPVSGKWRVEHPIYIRAQYRKLALEAAKEKPRLIIFPLYDFPEDILREPKFFAGLAIETGSYILVGSHIPKEVAKSILQEGFINMAVLYAPDGKIAGQYQAVQATPFGTLPEFTNKTYQVLDTPFGKLGVLLCFEDTIPGVTKKAIREGAEILIALSNPGFFSSTHLPFYHFVQDQLRAIESRRWILRVSANGYSGAIDPKGRIVRQSSLNREEILTTEVEKNSRRAFFQGKF